MSTVIKMIGKKHFILSLIETDSGNYYVETETDNGVEMTPKMQDLNVAIAVFETRLQELEGF